MASAAFNKEALALKLSPITRNVKQKRRKSCVWENALASKNSGEINCGI